LVFNSGEVTSPVSSSFNSVFLLNFNVLKSLGDLESEVSFSKFLLGEVHELGEAQSIGLFGALVEVLDDLVVVVEDGESVPVLVRSGVLLVVLFLPVVVKIVNLRFDLTESLRDFDTLVTHVDGGAQKSDGS
jgi:hypothetical protein